MTDLKTTPLDSWHRGLGARMVPFAGYAMPVQYDFTGALAERCRGGVLAEHLHCRSKAALFDVSHMGQATMTGAGAAEALERLVPGDILGLKPGRQRYTLLTNEAGGIIDDLMVANLGDDRLFLVVNASRKDVDFAHIPGIVPIENRALLALQGPAEWLVGHEAVVPAGLGARDSLRLEAGLCLYGHDLDETTTPVEAGLTWVIGKRRKMSWDFPGGAIVRDQLDNGAPRLRVGIKPTGRAPAREGTAIEGAGIITSGGFSPSLNAPIAMGYVRREFAEDGTALTLTVRGKPMPATVVPMPFVPHRYAR